MLNAENLKEIENNLNNGKEVVILCDCIERQVELEKQTFNFSGKLRIKNIKELK